MVYYSHTTHQVGCHEPGDGAARVQEGHTAQSGQLVFSYRPYPVLERVLPGVEFQYLQGKAKTMPR